jgi:cysteine-rich repeat protein
LILTHGIDFDTSGQSQPQSTVNMSIAGLPGAWSVDLSDDAGEFKKTSATTAAGDWTFNKNSDGGVLGGLPFPGTWIITVDAQFVKGISAWAWVRSDLTRTALTMGDTVTIQAFDEASFCRTNCTIPTCGDGILDGGEVCDDGNTIDGDGCAGDCKHFD